MLRLRLAGIEHVVGEEDRMQVKGTSKVGARKDGSGLLESAEAGNWMVHVDLRDFLS